MNHDCFHVKLPTLWDSLFVSEAWIFDDDTIMFTYQHTITVWRMKIYSCMAKTWTWRFKRCKSIFTARDDICHALSQNTKEIYSMLFRILGTSTGQFSESRFIDCHRCYGSWDGWKYFDESNIIRTCKINGLKCFKISSFLFVKTSFAWSNLVQGVALASFFIGYLLAQVPAGFGSLQFGGKNLIGIGLGICGFFGLIIPATTDVGVAMMIVARIIQGIGGVIFQFRIIFESATIESNDHL